MQDFRWSSENVSSARTLVSRWLIVCAALSTVLALPTLGLPQASQEKCSSLKTTFSMANTSITSAEVIAAGTFSPSDPGPRAVPVTSLPTFCRVIGVSAPSSDSQIGFEVWMPLAGWNGKFQAVGNHTLGGVYYYGDMGLELKRNFAVASTDTGHVGASAEWGAGHPEKAKDFGWRGVHEMTLAAKAVIAAYYGANPHFSYFNGCSTGGREALKEAQKFPADYDGIVSGSAMNHWTHSHIEHIWTAQDFLKEGANGDHYIPPAKYPLIINAALTKCRASDSEYATDAFLKNPSRCDWNPQTLVCKAGQDANTCITAAQAEALEAIYTPLRNPRTMEEIYPASAITSEPPNPEGLTSGPAEKYLQWMVFNKPDWNYRLLNFDSDVKFTDDGDAQGPQINAIDPDLHGFKQRHGKLIEYHGWVDPGFTPEFAVEYYESVIRAMGKPGRSVGDAQALKDTQDFYRLFMVPGMGHCSGGPGPNAFGGLAQPETPVDAQHDLLTALEQWVENGVAPQQIIATKYLNDDPKQGTAMQRPLCPYPQEAHYKGQGDPAQAANFECVEQPRNLKPWNSR
jgi:tannase/feruloyl esterase